MIVVQIKEQAKFDEDANTFIEIPSTALMLEHSLKSLQQWEARWKKPFLGKEDKSLVEFLDYIYCMCLNKTECSNQVIQCIEPEDLERIATYINEPMTATWFSNNDRVGASNRRGEVVTAEIIYYWMVSLRVPVEFENWHLNQLLTLLKVINIKNEGEKKMSKRDAAAQRMALNKQRKASLKTRG